MNAIPKERHDPIGLPPLEETNQETLNRLLDPVEGAPFELRAALRSRLGLPAETPATPATGTNAPSAKVSSK